MSKSIDKSRLFIGAILLQFNDLNQCIIFFHLNLYQCIIFFVFFCLFLDKRAKASKAKVSHFTREGLQPF